MPCTTIFDGDNDDEALKYKPRLDPEERSACLEWLVNGPRKYLSNPAGERYREPSAVTECIRECRDDNDVVGQFLQDCTVTQAGAFASYAELHRAFSTWFSQTQGMAARMTQTALTRTLKRRRGLHDYRGSAGRGLAGLKVNKARMNELRPVWLPRDA